MARKCSITGKGVQSGNNRSHSNIKTRRRYLPNLQNFSLLSDVLGRAIRMRITTSTMRTIDHNGGLDAYLLSTSDTKLTAEARKIKRMIEKAKSAAA